MSRFSKGLESPFQFLRRKRRWAFKTEGWHTPSLARLLDEGWEPFGFQGGIVALRKRIR